MMLVRYFLVLLLVIFMSGCNMLSRSDAELAPVVERTTVVGVATAHGTPSASAATLQSSTEDIDVPRVYAQPSYTNRTGAVQLVSLRPVGENDGVSTARESELPLLALETPLRIDTHDSESVRLALATPSAGGPEMPSNPASRALVNQGQVHEQAQRYEEAAASYERALEIEPDDAWLWHRLAHVRDAQGLRRLAVELARRSNQLAVDDAAVQAANARFMARP